jgi:hypothetical protein
MVGLALLLLVTLAEARPRDEAEDAARRARERGPVASASEIPALAALLQKAQWEPTPELSGVFAAGALFEVTAMGHRSLATGCIAAPPQVHTYTSAELVTSLQAGVSIGGPLAFGGGAGASIVKKVKFGTPSQVSIPRLDLELTEACRVKLERMPKARIDQSYVVQEVLKAEISEQTCGKVDASGRFVGLGAAEAEYASACAQASLEPVAVGYRTVPLAELLGESAPAPNPVDRDALLGEALEACVNAEAATLLQRASAEAAALAPLLRNRSAYGRETGEEQVRRFVDRYANAEVACTNELGEGRMQVQVAEVAAMQAWLNGSASSSTSIYDSLTFGGDVAGQIGGLTATGGSSTWDAAVKRILVGAYDSSGDGLLDQLEEVDRVSCMVWSAIDVGIRSGGGTGLRVIYGFDPGLGWVGSALGVDASQRTAAQARIEACGISR